MNVPKERAPGSKNILFRPFVPAGTVFPVSSNRICAAVSTLCHRCPPSSIALLALGE